MQKMSPLKQKRSININIKKLCNEHANNIIKIMLWTSKKEKD